MINKLEIVKNNFSCGMIILKIGLLISIKK